MLLGGLWHGANWTFMLWGGLHGFYLSINHAFRHATQRRRRTPPAWRLPLHIASVALTFAATSLAWIVFRAPDLASRAQCRWADWWASAIPPCGELLAAGGGGAAAAVRPGLVHAQHHGADVALSPGPALALSRPAGGTGTALVLAPTPLQRRGSMAWSASWRCWRCPISNPSSISSSDGKDPLRRLVSGHGARWPSRRWRDSTPLAGAYILHHPAGGSVQTLSGFERALKPVWLDQIQPRTGVCRLQPGARRLRSRPDRSGAEAAQLQLRRLQHDAL